MPTARISDTTHKRLRSLAVASGESIQTVLEKAIDAYRQEHFWKACSAAFTALRANRRAWDAEEAERRMWDATLGDIRD